MYCNSCNCYCYTCCCCLLSKMSNIEKGPDRFFTYILKKYVFPKNWWSVIRSIPLFSTNKNRFFVHLIINCPFSSGFGSQCRWRESRLLVVHGWRPIGGSLEGISNGIHVQWSGRRRRSAHCCWRIVGHQDGDELNFTNVPRMSLVCSCQKRNIVNFYTFFRCKGVLNTRMQWKNIFYWAQLNRLNNEVFRTRWRLNNKIRWFPVNVRSSVFTREIYSGVHTYST